MTDPNSPAYGHGNYTDGGAPGVSKREYLAALAMQGLLANPKFSDAAATAGVYGNAFTAEVSQRSIENADALIEALNQESK